MSLGQLPLVNNDRSESMSGVPTLASLMGRRMSTNQNEADHDEHLSGDAPHVPSSSVDASSSVDSIDSEKGEKHGTDEQTRREEEIHELALALTRHSTTWSTAGAQHPFHPEPNSTLDPTSPNFKARSWIKSLVQLKSRDPENYPERTAGVAFRNLSAFGFGATTDYQKSVGNVALELVGLARRAMGQRGNRIDILQKFDGLVEAGEMLVVLGPPGSGCSTFLKTIAGETHGFNISEDSHLNYQGISAQQMHQNFRGEAIYTAEVDVHFPMLTVGETLSFAALARAPRVIPGDVDKALYAEHMRNCIMAMYGISHTVNTRVGNDFIRGVSGGERKRVTIAEATLSQAPLQCWDNSTRGLDSANAVEFCKTIRTQCDLMGATACVAIYQAPQSCYDVFDKVTVLYEGHQIFFGRATEGKQYFVSMGFECPDRQTTADFLTSMTSPVERIVRPGYENRVPRTSKEFAELWKNSPERAQLLRDIEEYDRKFPIHGEALQKFEASRKAQQAKHQRVKSPYTLSYSQQVMLCLWRGFLRLKTDPAITITQLIMNGIMALIISSVFYNLPDTADSFFMRGALIFFAVLMSAFSSALEILTLYAQRPIVEKHTRYAMYHPSAEAIASMLTDIPYKVSNALMFNIVLYFMTNLRREPGPFFFFMLISFTITLTMSMMFRTIASVSRSLSQALAPAAILILAIVIYTGFAIPTRYMHGWARWINYIDPVTYGFESLLINEFHGRDFPCTQFVPDYPDATGLHRVCSAVGALPGATTVNGDTYIQSAFNYSHAHKWRNFGIMIAFMIGFMATYIAAAEFISAKKSKGEVLVFRRGRVPASHKYDTESGAEKPIVAQNNSSMENQSGKIEKQTAVFHWQNICYDVKIKREDRRILDHVDGWVKPGTLTALMGVSGAGKTTLLDVLATRVTMGVISGDALVDGHQRDASFQRKTGYVQQQDLHLSTSTVREALEFSALLRQPAHISKEDKLAYVDEVIRLLEMEEYAEAVVGVPGEGLNVEQRKRLTIGVELVAKPQLLIFFDEPTSGLDSQTSWSICNLMEKLTKSGQAILCTIHQPSAVLFQRFDRLLFLAKGGRTVYFGDIGQNSQTLINYFEKNGGFPCPPEANPAEWMLQVIGAAPGTHTDIDWFDTWRNSPEYQEVQAELDRLKQTGASKAITPQGSTSLSVEDKASYREFAAPFMVQSWLVTRRVFEQYWRTPSYIYSKIALCTCSALFIGFSFYRARNSQQGLQNQMFGIFMMMTIFGQLAQQIMPLFVTQRSLYEVRERPAKTYSWRAFMLGNIIVEIPWQTLMAVIMYFCWYYPIGLWRNAEPTDAVHERGALMFLFILTFMLFTSTFAHMAIAAIPDAETGGNLANFMFSLCLMFCGVLASPSTFPHFWIFMYRLSPFTYLISGMLSTAVANTNVVCADNEYLTFQPTANQTCEQYMEPTISKLGGYLLDKQATDQCQYCTMDSTNSFLASVNVSYDDAWRNFGLMWVYIVFNICAAVFLYWLGRVPKKGSKKQ